MTKEERLQIEQKCLLNYSKAQMINKYIDELEENTKLTELWLDSQTKRNKAIEYIKTHQLVYTSQYEEMSGFDNHLLDILGD